MLNREMCLNLVIQNTGLSAENVITSSKVVLMILRMESDAVSVLLHQEIFVNTAIDNDNDNDDANAAVDEHPLQKMRLTNNI